MKKMHDNMLSFSFGAVLSAGSYINSADVVRSLVLSLIGGLVAAFTKKITDFIWGYIKKKVEKW